METQRDGLKAGFPFQQLFKAAAIDVADFNDLLNRPEGSIHVSNLFRSDFKSIGGQVLGQQNAIAVVDQASVGRYRLQLDAVVF